MFRMVLTEIKGIREENKDFEEIEILRKINSIFNRELQDSKQRLSFVAGEIQKKNEEIMS